MYEKIEQIILSYYNGQKAQMVNQIKAYGIKKFFVDYFENQELYHYNDTGLYGRIVYTFFMLK